MGIIDQLKSVANVARQMDKLDLYREILDLQAGVQDLTEENRSLKREIEGLKQQLQTREALVFEDHVYWLRRATDDQKDGPYCPRCWDVDSKPVRLKIRHDGYRQCPNCDKAFESAEYRRRAGWE